jgi:amidase
MTVKDTFDVEGLPASAGMTALLDRTAEDAAVGPVSARRTRSCGAKTNTPVKAADWQTYNPLWDHEQSLESNADARADCQAGRQQPLHPTSPLWKLGRISLVRYACQQVFAAFFVHKPTHGLVSQGSLVPRKLR